jgi:hypothetical protein
LPACESQAVTSGFAPTALFSSGVSLCAYEGAELGVILQCQNRVEILPSQLLRTRSERFHPDAAAIVIMNSLYFQRGPQAQLAP